MTNTVSLETPRHAIYLAVLVAALGYFVDIYDLLLFSIVRVKSLVAIGVAQSDLLSSGVYILNMQMVGMLIGGIIWGVLGDRIGRRSVLFGSIFLYSVANIANAFVHTVDTYALLRFVAGVGLAGELGAGITLVSEVMPAHTRGYGTSLVAVVGLCGAVVAAFVGDYFDWRNAYIVGGLLGLTLLMLRIGVHESGLFVGVKRRAVSRGNFLSFFLNWRRFTKYLAVVFVGLPLWYIVGILLSFAPELGKALGMTTLPSAGNAVKWGYLGGAIGNLLSGLLSQYLRSRKKAIAIFLVTSMAGIAGYYLLGGRSPATFYAACFWTMLASGYWALFVTVASEQFGTNVRATATTTAPNFVRGATPLMTLGFRAGIASLGVLGSAIAVGAVVFLIAFLCLAHLDETYGKDLNFVED